MKIEKKQKINFNKSNLGFNYIIDCLSICVNNNYHFIPKMNILYEQLINNNYYINRSFNAVKWNISKAVQTMTKLLVLLY